MTITKMMRFMWRKEMVRLWCISYKKIVACEVKELLQWCCGVAEAVKEYGKLGRDWWR